MMGNWFTLTAFSIAPRSRTTAKCTCRFGSEKPLWGELNEIIVSYRIVWPILFDAVMLVESCPCRSSPKIKFVIGVPVEQRAPYSRFKWGFISSRRCRERLICKFPNSANKSALPDTSWPKFLLHSVSELDSLARNSRSASVILVNALPVFVSVL